MNSQAPARRNVSVQGISYCLEVEPRSLTGSYFNCPKCGRPVFDGGIPKVADCSCGGVLLRDENNLVSESPRVPITRFEDLFRVRTSAPPNNTMPTLTSVTFGFFGDGSMEPDMALRTALLPFILHRDRCFGINDLVEVLGLQFKVLAAEPLYGVAKRTTKIQCHTLLGTQPLTKIIVGAVYPKSLTTEECSQKVIPYLCTPLRHVHERTFHLDQYIYTPELSFVILEASPKSGFVNAQTQVMVERRSLGGLHQVAFTPNVNTLPPEYRQLHPQILERVLLDGYLRPHFLGWHKPLIPGEVVTIGHIGFSVALQPGVSFGFLGSQTQVQVRVPYAVAPGRVYAQYSNQMANIVRIAGPARPQAQVRFTDTNVRNSLPTKIVTQEYLDRRDSCVVCLDEYSIGQTLKSLPCSED